MTPPFVERFAVPDRRRRFGIVVHKDHADHPSPHFQARDGEREELLSIQPISILRGEMPRRTIDLVIESATPQRGGLAEN